MSFVCAAVIYVCGSYSPFPRAAGKVRYEAEAE